MAEMMTQDEGLAYQAANDLARDTMERTGMAWRMTEFGIAPMFSTWAFLDHGKPTMNAGILFTLEDGTCVGMYHFHTKKILISRIGFGPGGVPGLTRFAHQMDECDSAADFFNRLPALIDAYGKCREATGKQ